jgi:intracellular sulfur oxidation DsrE/DsrF family protein
MNQEHRLSEEQLNAFIDGQLDAEENERILARIDHDPDLGAQVCGYRQLQDLVQHAYELPAPRDSGRSSAGWGNMKGRAQALVACLLLAVGAAGGWIAHSPQFASGTAPGSLSLANAGADAATEHGPGVIVHLASSDPARVNAALEQAERLLRQNARLGNNVPVEVLVNGTGLDLLRADTTTNLKRIQELRSRYANVSFLACRKTLERFKLEHGVDARLVNEAEVASSALDQILVRLRQGWSYIQI